jgi:outer membrane protein OmpA-like peptidoglycan-associated protein/tetratricopeptide (TPR) repeat protein
MKKISITVLAFCLIANLQAQVVYDYLRAADNYFAKKDWASAAEYYEKYLGTNGGKAKGDSYNPYTIDAKAKKTAATSSKEQAIYNLAESYRLLNYPSKAETPYRQTVEQSKNRFPLAEYYYATVLRSLEKFEEAEKTFQSFLAGYSTTDQWSEAAKREILNLQFIQKELKKKDLTLYKISKAGSDLNPEGANYSPVWMTPNTILFTSTRADNSADKNNVHANRIYQASYTEGSPGGVSLASIPQQKDMQQGTPSLSPDGTAIYLTRWSVADGRKNSSIWFSRKAGNSWGEPVMMNASINEAGYNSQQPFIMADGKTLLFASNKPGGSGGFDLWSATIDMNGTASNVQNLGSRINTSFDEQAPYYHAASNSMIFSSNGRVGMGGYDFFQSKGQLANLSEPVNLGYPVNSVKDDIYFVSRGDSKNILADVLLSSDRSAACCLELFSLKKEKLQKQITGMVVNCETKQPVPGAVITIYDSENKVVFTKTITDGNYLLTLDEFQPLKAIATAEGFEKAELSFNAPSDEASIKLQNPDICLVKIKVPEVGTVVVLDNVYYKFDKHQLEPESYPALDKVVKMMLENPTMEIEISGHTDSKGSDKYNQVLSQLRAEACVDYIVSKGISRTRLVAKGYGESVPIVPNTNDDGTDNPEGREKNRRTEFKVLKK